jgi:predicted Zn-dependent protease with MMP-like domain
MLSLDREGFEALVREALADLPEEFAENLDNIAVVVEDEPDPRELLEMGLEIDEELFGLYQGVPLVVREASYSGLPDRVVIYMGPILRACSSPEQVEIEVRETVIHELGHHFGLSDDEMPY